jgi:CMP/dCMP kinase
VFPDAACKFYLTAEPRVRAGRRAAELATKGQVVTVEAVLADQAERDARDADRDLAPMKPAPDAVIVDTTHLTTDQVIEQIEKIVRDRRDRGNK